MTVGRKRSPLFMWICEFCDESILIRAYTFLFLHVAALWNESKSWTDKRISFQDLTTTKRDNSVIFRYYYKNPHIYTGRIIHFNSNQPYVKVIIIN